MRTVGQKDPLLEFKHEAFALFHSLSHQIKLEVAHGLFKFEMRMADPELPRTQTINLPKIKEVKSKKAKKNPLPTSPLIDLSLFDENPK